MDRLLLALLINAGISIAAFGAAVAWGGVFEIGIWIWVAGVFAQVGILLCAAAGWPSQWFWDN